MSLRTVWEKYNYISATKYKAVSESASQSFQIKDSDIDNTGVGYNISTTSGVFSLTDAFDWTNNKAYPDINEPCYYKIDNVVYYGVVTKITSRVNGDTIYSTTVYFTASQKYTASAYESYTKGNTNYGNVSSAASGAYPSSGKSGNYWYVKKGTDTLDPSAITFDTPHGGQVLDISITPSAGKVYGGTTYYKYEYSLDGGTSWNVANESTTAETISVLVPYGSASFTARVTASDDLGFTSTDAITGETLTVINNAAPVITCGVTDLGTVEAGFTVDYAVSDSDGDTVTVDVNLDGAKIQSGVTPTGGVLAA